MNEDAGHWINPIPFKPMKTFTFIHAFRDGSRAKCFMKESNMDWQYFEGKECQVELPMGKGKRWLNECERWLGEVIIPFQCSNPKPTFTEFYFQS